VFLVSFTQAVAAVLVSRLVQVVRREVTVAVVLEALMLPGSLEPQTQVAVAAVAAEHLTAATEAPA
jgi:hypothetical protein